MPFSLSKFLQDHIDNIVVGPPQFDRLGRVPNMVVYPLFPTSLDPHPSPLITLSEAMRRGVSLHDTGLVNRVHVDNPLPASVLAGESDVLLGPTQLRSLQYSCLVPPYCRASLPVNCVEEGQPTEYQARFTQSSALPMVLAFVQNGEPGAIGGDSPVRGLGKGEVLPEYGRHRFENP